MSQKSSSRHPCFGLASRHACIVLSVLLLSPAVMASEPPGVLEGWLSIVWADTPPGEDPISYRKLTLTDDNGKSLSLSISEQLLHQGIFRWNGRRVRVYPVTRGASFTKNGELRVAAIQLAGSPRGVSTFAVTGSQPWISLLCKFADIGDEPQNLEYFQGMYANAPGRLDHYWREVSSSQIDIVGSLAVDWVDLPDTQVSYAPTPGAGTNADLDQIFSDCTAAVDPIVDFSRGGAPFAGINLMVNALLDCCAWGGGRYATLDGVTKVWRTTWNPPWSFGAEAIIAHEMGHGFGLPHANNWDGDGNPYDSPWDVMSSATGYATYDATYGPLGKHVNAYHKDSLGWIPPARRFEAPPHSSTSIELDHTAHAGGTNYQIARIPIDADHGYTVEARVRSGDYEAGLAGDAVIIHHIDLTRSEPAWAVDAAQPPADFSDNPGTMWTVGETFTDDDNQISVAIDYATVTGFGVTITVGDGGIVFTDGFESGDALSWSSSSGLP